MEAYKQSLQAIGLSIERATPVVPADGYYYVLLHGEIQGRHRTLGKAQTQYKALREQSGWTPPPVEAKPVDHSKAAVDAYMDALEGFWGSSHQNRQRGGKGR